MSNETRLEVTGLDKSFGTEFQLSEVDLTVGAGEIVALLGPSGCGKTTCLRCIAGVERPDAGAVVIGDDLVEGDGVSKPPEQRKVGMVYQDYAIWPHKSVYENVVFPLKHADHSIPSDQYEERVDAILTLMGIEELTDAPATDLSGGQQQRTALARSLVHDPDLLLLDEPLSNLDRTLRKQMRYELQRLQYELGISMLYVTHDQEEAFYLADRVLVMNSGEIVERGTPRELYQQPTALFTRQFIGVRNEFHGRVVPTGDGERVIRTELLDFRVTADNYVSAERATGTVMCFLRPEDVSIFHPETSADGSFELVGTVVAEGLLGERYEVTVRFEDASTELVVYAEPRHVFDRGDRIGVRIQPERVQVYETDE